MVMRLTENLKFSTMTNNIYLSQSKYAELMEQISSQKRINRPSDDPVGMRTVLDGRRAKSAIEQYQRNMDSGKGWLDITETTLNGANELITRLREIAVAQGSANASADSRSIAAATVGQIIEEMRSLANTQYGGRYLFGGTRTDTEPFSETPRASASIGAAQAAGGNAFDGTVASGGAYTGSANKTYVVKIVSGGTLASATYAVSADGGRTWGATQADLDTGTVTIGDGITLTFADTGSNRLAADDVFHVQANAAGYYNGNGDDLSVQIGEDAAFSYSLSGESVFTNQGDGTVDIFGVLDGLKTALENNDADGVGSALDGLVEASGSFNLRISECGTKQNRLELAGNSLSDLDLRMTELISNTEDADTAQVVMEFQQKELALQASYQIAASLSQTTILQFLR